MAKKRTRLPRLMSRAVTAERAGRICRLLHLLGTGPQSRERLIKRLSLDIRGFYRDLELLRAAGIAVSLRSGRYLLKGTVAGAVARLPLPDPHLTLGEAMQLAKGRTPAHRKIKQQIASILG
jgi:hypothetical protein